MMGNQIQMGPNENRPIIICLNPVDLPQHEKRATGRVVRRLKKSAVKQASEAERPKTEVARVPREKVEIVMFADPHRYPAS
jgi:hypothetical protein